MISDSSRGDVMLSVNALKKNIKYGRLKRTKNDRINETTSSLLDIANSRPLDESAYFKYLFALYLQNRNYKLSLNYDYKSREEIKYYGKLSVLFMSEPVNWNGRQGCSGDGRSKGYRVSFNEFSALSPIYFCDCISSMTCSQVLITGFRFGCLRVDYKLLHPEAASMIDIEMIRDLIERLQIKSLKIDGRELLEV